MLVKKWVNPRTVRPADIDMYTACGYKVVATAWDNGVGMCWCAYRGPLDWPNDRVLLEGDAIPAQVAEMLFTSFTVFDWPYYNP